MLTRVSLLTALVACAAVGACAARGAGVGPVMVAVARGEENAPVGASSSTSPSELAEPDASDGAIGTAHPVTVEAAAADGGWVVLCQARADSDGDGTIAVKVGARGELSGDRLQRYLVEGSGAGEPIDGFVAADPSGRHLVLERSERLVLRDSWERAELDLTELGAVAGTDRASFVPHRAAVFSPDGRRLAYLRRKGPRDWVVVRELESGQEALFDPGEGLLYRVEFDASGHWLVLRVVDADTNGDGRWDWPHGKPSPRALACPSPIPEFRAPLVPADKPSVRVAPASGGAVQPVRGFVTALGPAGWLRRSDDRALFFDRAGGRGELWSPSACDGRLLHADAARGVLLIACATEEGPRELTLVRRESRQELELTVAAFEIDQVLPAAPRLVPAYLFPPPGTVLVDLELGQALPLDRRDRVLGSHGLNVLVRRNGGLYWGDPREPLSRIGDLDPLAQILHQPPLVFAAPWAVDLAAPSVLGRVDGDAFALSRRGAVLTARTPRQGAELSVGPLDWQNPG